MVVLALARLVREAIEADDSEDSERESPRRRMAGQTPEPGVKARLSRASESAA
jgi:hypothetical protein